MSQNVQTTKEVCELCGRTVASVTQHHLIPRTCHSNRWFKKRFSRVELSKTIKVCRDCHSAIHVLIDDQKKLGRQFNSLETLAAHPAIAKYLSWVRDRR